MEGGVYYAIQGNSYEGVDFFDGAIDFFIRVIREFSRLNKLLNDSDISLGAMVGVLPVLFIFVKNIDLQHFVASVAFNTSITFVTVSQTNQYYPDRNMFLFRQVIPRTRLTYFKPPIRIFRDILMIFRILATKGRNLTGLKTFIIEVSFIS